ncbi:hypothetical protein T4D_7094 [Trichinella pseudospiralis]|uniref:Uncharacterized protein n=1 Tax=Trichinella pseudospiralis TaxID=6337 RepID=A0A0V1F2W6_TRIPS|nr:hypothetical protein T4D_7094 [Trichinella pseudospiralis]
MLITAVWISWLFNLLSIPMCNLSTLSDTITNGKRSGSYERVDNRRVCLSLWYFPSLFVIGIEILRLRYFPNKFFIFYNMQIYVFHHPYAIGYAMPPSIRCQNMELFLSYWLSLSSGFIRRTSRKFHWLPGCH